MVFSADGYSALGASAALVVHGMVPTGGHVDIIPADQLGEEYVAVFRYRQLLDGLDGMCRMRKQKGRWIFEGYGAAPQ